MSFFIPLHITRRETEVVVVVVERSSSSPPSPPPSTTTSSRSLSSSIKVIHDHRKTFYILEISAGFPNAKLPTDQITVAQKQEKYFYRPTAREMHIQNSYSFDFARAQTILWPSAQRWTLWKRRFHRYRNICLTEERTKANREIARQTLHQSLSKKKVCAPIRLTEAPGFKSLSCASRELAVILQWTFEG